MPNAGRNSLMGVQTQSGDASQAPSYLRTRSGIAQSIPAGRVTGKIEMACRRFNRRVGAGAPFHGIRMHIRFSRYGRGSISGRLRGVAYLSIYPTAFKDCRIRGLNISRKVFRRRCKPFIRDSQEGRQEPTPLQAIRMRHRGNLE